MCRHRYECAVTVTEKYPDTRVVRDRVGDSRGDDVDRAVVIEVHAEHLWRHIVRQSRRHVTQRLQDFV